MRSLFAVIAMLIITASSVVPAEAGARDRTTKMKPTVTTDHIIKDLTIPWPFRHHSTGHKVASVGDSDGDGVTDDADDCPDTPRGATVDARGCPSDDDGDGVYDGIDRCPNTPKNLAVDKYGCPIELSETETTFLDTGVIRTSDVKFASTKADLEPESYKVLDEIGLILVQWPSLEIEIGGHTDSLREEDYNQKLSEQRAAAVRDYLVKKFPKIDGKKMKVKGYGESTPIATNDTDKGRAQNRRVEFTVLNKETLKQQIERKGLKKRN